MLGCSVPAKSHSRSVEQTMLAHSPGRHTLSEEQSQSSKAGSLDTLHSWKTLVTYILDDIGPLKA